MCRIRTLYRAYGPELLGAAVLAVQFTSLEKILSGTKTVEIRALLEALGGIAGEATIARVIEGLPIEFGSIAELQHPVRLLASAPPKARCAIERNRLIWIYRLNPNFEPPGSSIAEEHP